MTEQVDLLVTPVALDRDRFLQQLIASLGQLNEGILGSEVAGAYVMNVGLSMGAAIEAEYKRFWHIDRPFTLDEYAHVIVDLKRKIEGNFSLVSKEPAKVVVRTTTCPYDAAVRRSPSLCFITSSVFGGIAARNFGYGKVVLHKRIALGDPGCYVSIHLARTPEAREDAGKEYFPEPDSAGPDIAEQLRLMESLRRLRRQLGESTSRWDELIEGTAEAICVIEPDGRISLANARWRDLLGMESDELAGASWRSLVQLEDHQRMEELLEQVLRGERVVGHELRFSRRDGLPRLALVSGGPVRDEIGAIARALFVVRDVTHEREMQRLKDTFLASASHELRTPLTTIRGLTEVLLRRLQASDYLDPAMLGGHLQTIRQEADRLALLSGELLDITRLQSRRLQLRRSCEDMGALLQECVARQRDLLAETDPHEITCSGTPQPVLVHVDRRRIEHILSHLLENAIKYSPRGGTITATLSVAEDQVHVCIADHGIGIPSEDLRQIFTPFYRASNASLFNYGGLGLGLFMDQVMVEEHGGTLSVTSIEGGGTTVTLALPRAAGPA